MPLKFAFLGAWHSHTPMHVREAAARPEEFELVGMYDPDPQVIRRNQQRWKEQFPEIRVFPTVAAVLESNAEAVVVEGEIFQNLDYVEQALEAGKHVLLEKPAGVDLEQLQRVQALAKRRGLMLQMAYMWRYNPAIHEILRLGRAGALGEIFYYRGHIPKPKSWHARIGVDVGRYQGAVYFEMAGHLLDIMVALMGEPKAVHPVLARHYGDRQHVDNAVVTHEFERGLGIVDTAAMHIGMDRTRRIEVYGTKGTAIHTPIGGPGFSLCLEEAGHGYAAGWQEVTPTPPPEFPTLLRELAACIRGAKQPDYPMEHDLRVQRVLFAGSGIKGNRAC